MISDVDQFPNMTTFTPSQRETLIWQLSISPRAIETFDIALKDVEDSSILYGIDWVAKVIELSEDLAIIESGTGSSGAIDPTNSLAPILGLVNQGVRSFQTEELKVEFSGGAGVVNDANETRRKILAIFADFGYHFWTDHALLLRS